MRTHLAGLIGVAALAVSGSVQAAGLCVAPGGVGGCFATIGAAIAAATAGTEIKIGAGRYPENVVIPAGLDALKLVGKGATLAVINPAAGIGIDIQANNVSVTGLGVRNTAMVPVNIAMNVTGTVLNKLDLRNPADGADACLVTGAGATGTQLLSSRLETCTGTTLTGNDVVVRSNRFVNIAAFAAVVTGDNAVVEKNIVENAVGGDFVVAGDNSKVQTNNSYNSLGPVVTATTNNVLYKSNKLFGPFTAPIVVGINNPQVLSNVIKEGGSGAILTVVCTTSCALSQVNSNRIEGATTAAALVVDNTGNGGVIGSNLVRNISLGAGILVSGAGQQTVQKNTVRTTLTDGIQIAATAPVRVLSNNVQNAGFTGIALMSDVAHFVEKNVASNNREAGILIIGTLPILVGNTANNNQEEGIENVGGATALTGNKAKGNFNFDYCSAVLPIPAPGNFFGTTGATCI